MNLSEILLEHRNEIIDRARARIGARGAPLPTVDELVHGVPLFLTQLGRILSREGVTSVHEHAMGATATRHGAELLEHDFSIAQVVHDYGDLCQAITELILDRGLSIEAGEFQTLNRCLDNAIASAVTEYSRRREMETSEAELRRIGFFAHELRNHLNTAMLAFQAVKSGRVGVGGSTVAMLERSLRGLADQIDRSVSEVRLTAGILHLERLAVAEFIDEMEVDAGMSAASRGLRLSIDRPSESVFVDVDRHLFASAISNLVQNALKFTRPGTCVTLRGTVVGERVAIEVEDECGGLVSGAPEELFRPFEQRGIDRSGLGLGLSISRQAIEIQGGTLSVRDLPGKGCIFVVEMPLASPSPIAEPVDAAAP